MARLGLTDVAPLRIGLTGGIGSGTSTVATLLASLGAAIVDTDRIARELTLPGGAGIAPLQAAFGDAAIAADGSLDRARMRELAFADATAKERLEAILHPLIGMEVEREAMSANPAPAIVFDVPLLVESRRWRSRVGRVWVVDCTEQRQIERVVARSGWREDQVRAALAQQASRAARRASADAVIDNDHLSLAELESEVRELWEATLLSRR